jgi:hypothetical protein
MKLYDIRPTCKEFSWGEMQCLALGEEGRGRKRVIIPFHASFDEEASDYEIGQTRKGNPKIIRTGKSSEGWIARINCYYTYTRNTRGYYEIIAGNVEEITVGFGAFGTAGRIGSWDDALVTVKPPFPAIIKVYPSGGRHKIAPYYLVFMKDKVDRVQEDEWDVYAENVPCL